MNATTRSHSGAAGRRSRARAWAAAGAAAAVLLASALPTALPAAPSGKPAAAAKAAGGLSVDFDKSTYAAKKFPGWCTIYGVFRNSRKVRPLFAIGRGAGGALNLGFDTSGLTEKDEPEAASGEGKIVLEFSDQKRDITTFFRGEDWNTYACGQWVQAEETPWVEVTLSNLVEWKSKDKQMHTFLNPDRKRPPAGTPDIQPAFTAKLDLALRVGNSRANIKALPCTVRFTDCERYWEVRFDIKTELPGMDLGLVGDDAGPISLQLAILAYCTPPKSHGAPTVDTELKAVPSLGGFSD